MTCVMRMLTAVLCFALLGENGAAVAGTAPGTCQAIESAARRSANDHLTALGNLYQAGCLGGENDAGGQAQRVTAAIKAINTKSGNDATGSITTIMNELKVVQQELDGDSAGDRSDAMLPLLVRPLHDAIEKIATGSKDLTGPHKPDFWQYQADTGNLAGIELGIVEKTLRSCGDVGAKSCQDEYERSKRTIRYAVLIERVETLMTRDLIARTYQYVEFLDKQWNHYFNDARSQFWWELELNSAIYGANAKGRDGLQQPPDYQWILLHPSIAYEYVDTMRGERYKEALVMEVVGYNAWKWSAGGDMECPMGMSLIATYSDRAGAEPWGYGALFHLNNNLSLGVTRHDKETGFLISLDLARLFIKTGDKDKKKIRFGASAESHSGI